MNELAFLQIMLFGLCVLGGISVLIFGLRQCDDDIDYDRIIRELNEREEKDLDIINRGNKQIDELESRILECKKKLELRGEGDGQIFTCRCGYREKMSAFQKRRQQSSKGKVSKRDVQKYMKQQEDEPVNDALANALKGLKFD